MSHFPVFTTRTDARVYPRAFYAQRGPNDSVFVRILPVFLTHPLAELLGAAVVFVVRRSDGRRFPSSSSVFVFGRLGPGWAV